MYSMGKDLQRGKKNKSICICYVAKKKYSA